MISQKKTIGRKPILYDGRVEINNTRLHITFTFIMRKDTELTSTFMFA